MASQAVLERLAGIQAALSASHAAGSDLSYSSRGNERETFISCFLEQILPTPYRHGTGDVTDTAGNRSGQLDVVIELPFIPSLPLPAQNTPRLYLAEGVAAVIEVKSDVRSQWSEVKSTSRALSNVRRSFTAWASRGNGPTESIPLFVVGYRGWKKAETVARHSQEGVADGVLVIDPPIFEAPSFGIRAAGPPALWGLICCLHEVCTDLFSCSTDLSRYVIDESET